MASSGTESRQLGSLVDPDAELRLLADGFWFTEGPAWNPVEDHLVFSDIPNDTRWRWSEDRGLEEVMRPTFKGNGMAYEDDGCLLVCEHVTSCVARFRPSGEREVVAFHYRGKYLNSPNDLVTRGSDGSIYFTDPNYGRWDGPFGVGREPELDYQGLFRASRDGSEIDLVADEGEFEQPNGLCFSPDESLLYVNDSPRGEIKVFDVHPDGSLSAGRLFFSGIGTGEIEVGNPDGMECDEHGNVWCTGAGGVWVIDPNGERIGLLGVPEVCGSLAWGGRDWHSLYLTSSDKLYVVETEVASAPLPFQG